MRTSFQHDPSNSTARAPQKRLISAILTRRPDRAQLAQLEPENPKTIAATPAILAPDLHQASTSTSAARISACQNMPPTKRTNQRRADCSEREQRQNSERTTKPLQSIEIVCLFPCSRFCLAHIRTCVRAHMRIPPKPQNSENRPDYPTITTA